VRRGQEKGAVCGVGGMVLRAELMAEWGWGRAGESRKLRPSGSETSGMEKWGESELEEADGE